MLRPLVSPPFKDVNHKEQANQTKKKREKLFTTVYVFSNVYQVQKVSASASHLETFPSAGALPSTSKTSFLEERPSMMVN